VALTGVLSITNALNLIRTGVASQVHWGPLVEDPAWPSAASATRCLPRRMSSVATTGQRTHWSQRQRTRWRC